MWVSVPHFPHAMLGNPLQVWLPQLPQVQLAPHVWVPPLPQPWELPGVQAPWPAHADQADHMPLLLLHVWL
ncbi:MAG TPA: hypothetical protein VH374_10505 [Polyangia bacterium]|nr:hypothetical protein [Polyangia bacterium]